MANPVVAVAGDPGGANALVPVLELLRRESRPLRPYAYRQAFSQWTKQGLAVEELSKDLAPEQALTLLRELRAEALLTATSANGIDLEKRFLAAAKQLRVPSLTVLDFWSNYRRRFADETGRLAYLPDRIAVMDEQARREMLAEGFDTNCLCVTGQPAFDELDEYKHRFTALRRAAVRTSLGIGPDEWLVLFASQPQIDANGIEADDPRESGYTRHTVVASLIGALDRISQRRSQAIVMLIRPHPREHADDFKSYQGERVRILVDAHGEGRAAALAADLVTGMTTMLLVEACLMGCVVISLQPGLLGPDLLPTNRWGASQAVYHTSEIESVADRLLSDERARLESIGRTAGLRFHAGAAGRVVRLMESLVQQSDCSKE